MRQALPANEIHLWYARLDQPARRVQQLAHTLSPDEAERAARFHFEPDRRRFTAARGFLRAILGQYLGIIPARIKFCYGPHGKPALAPGALGSSKRGVPEDAGLQFNLAHSGEVALYALALGQPVGVDVEQLRPIPDLDQIAARFFSTQERAALQALPPEQRQAAFFNGWTRKEAYLKALGDGLARPLAGFDVSLAPGQPARLLGVAGDPAEAARWYMHALAPPTGYVGAVVAPAVEGQAWRVTCREWP